MNQHSIELVLFLLAPLASAGLIYSVPRLENAKPFNRIAAYSCASFILLVAIILFLRLVSPPQLDEDGLSEGVSAFFSLLGFVLSFGFFLIVISIVKQIRRRDLKAIAVGIAAVTAFIALLFGGSKITRWMDPYDQSQRAAAAAEKAGDCDGAIAVYKSQISEFSEHAVDAQARWARMLVACPDRTKRNPSEAQALILKAADAGTFDAETADIAACVFAENKEFERALSVARDNNLNHRLGLFSNRKTCFE